MHTHAIGSKIYDGWIVLSGSLISCTMVSTGQIVPIIAEYRAWSAGATVTPLLVRNAWLMLSNLSSGLLSDSPTLNVLGLNSQLKVTRKLSFLCLHE